MGFAGSIERLTAFLQMGGAAMWAIAALSVATLALILWKIWHLWWLGAFSGGRVSAEALRLWDSGDHDKARALLAPRHSARARVIRTSMSALDEALPRSAAESAAEQVARGVLAEARAGLRGLELAASVGPLLGLLGTVTGMIAAFQGLEAAGVRADTATLAGGIWEALLTTAAGMAVAIPAMTALTWFDGVVDRLRHDMEDGATRVFLAHDRTPQAARAREAAE